MQLLYHVEFMRLKCNYDCLMHFLRQKGIFYWLAACEASGAQSLVFISALSESPPLASEKWASK